MWKGLNGAIDGVDDATTPEGGYCAKASGDSWIGWGIFYTDGAHDLSSYSSSSLNFWVKTPVDLKVEVKTSGATERWISSYGWDGTNTWQRIVIPLNAFSADLSAVDSPFCITAHEGTTFYVDYVTWGSDSDVNYAPEIVTLPVTTTIADNLYQYDVHAIDLNGDVLTYSLTTSPSGMTINASTGLIQWTPTGAQVGTHAVTVSVSDGNGGSDTQNFNLIVVSSAPSDYLIYSDAGFAPNTTVYTWKGQNGSVDGIFDPSSPDGNYCARATGDSWIGWGIFYTDGPHDLSTYSDSHLMFWVATQFDLKVTVKTSAGVVDKWISSYGWDGTYNWQPITIPVSAFFSDVSQVESPFSITSYTAATFYVDYIRIGL
jgi:hypothetical protein